MVGMFGGLGQRLGGMFQRDPNHQVNNAVLMAGLGLMGGQNRGEQFQGAMQGIQAGTQMNQQRDVFADEKETKNATVAYLKRMDPSLTDADAKALIANPTLLSQKFAKPEAAKTTDDLIEFAQASKDGFQGGFLEFKKAQQSPSSTDMPNSYEEFQLAQQSPEYGKFLTERAKAQGIQLPAEMGARIGLGQQFQDELPDIKAKISGGAIDGVVDRGKLAIGMGEPTEIWRRIETGKESLIRNLTGAGMAAAEAANQAARYQISPTDSKETMLSKLEGLERDLKATERGAVDARSGTMTGASEAPVRRYNPATGMIE